MEGGREEKESWSKSVGDGWGEVNGDEGCWVWGGPGAWGAAWLATQPWLVVAGGRLRGRVALLTTDGPVRNTE